MKHFKTILILLILFGLPAGSWYFLKYGAQWRKDKLHSLESKANFVNSFEFSKNEKDELFALLSYKTTVVSFHGNPDTREDELIYQFRKSPSFQWLSILSDSAEIIPRSSKNPRKSFVHSNVIPLDNAFKNAEYMLLDTSMNIRQIYTERNEATLSKLIEDIAVVLPRQVTKDISIRKNTND